MIIERFIRHIDVIGGIDVQKKLREFKVLVFGLGGLGSYLTYMLACIGVKEIIIVDYDKVSITDLNRQILYDHKSIGKLKVSVAYRKLTNFVNDVSIVPVNTRIIKNNKIVEKLIENVDIVFDCLDNVTSRLIINDLCLKFRRPLVHGGVSREKGQVIFLPGNGPCLRCLIYYKESYARPVIAYSCAITASLQVKEFIEYVKGNNSPRIIMFDLSVPYLKRSSIDKLDKCKYCTLLT